jgi:hypothetical protein
MHRVRSSNPERPCNDLGAVSVNIDVTMTQLLAEVTAQNAAYSDDWRTVAVIRRILLRMIAWLNS